ncbi:hypothetical protein [Niastella sp. OAS944]|uniref:hypothetical protein n=1 Tax=Niastella sp. OAS944 TaxID=2664089 RepID=UPI00348315CE|nr:hypothetical protein [Chitinophagaceae bacterium OAS944]
MNKFVEAILKTVIPVVLATAIPVYIFWIQVKPQDNIEYECGVGLPNASDFLFFFYAVAAVGIIYQLSLGKFLRHKIKTGKAVELIIDVVAFATLFALLFSCYYLVMDSELLAIEGMMTGIIFGLLHEALISIFKKLYEYSRIIGKTNR